MQTRNKLSSNAIKLINAEVEKCQRQKTWRILSMNGTVPIRCNFVMGVSRWSFPQIWICPCLSVSPCQNLWSPFIFNRDVHRKVVVGVQSEELLFLPLCLALGKQRVQWHGTIGRERLPTSTSEKTVRGGALSGRSV